MFEEISEKLAGFTPVLGPQLGRLVSLFKAMVLVYPHLDGFTTETHAKMNQVLSGLLKVPNNQNYFDRQAPGDAELLALAAEQVTRFVEAYGYLFGRTDEEAIGALSSGLFECFYRPELYLRSGKRLTAHVEDRAYVELFCRSSDVNEYLCLLGMLDKPETRDPLLCYRSTEKTARITDNGLESCYRLLSGTKGEWVLVSTNDHDPKQKTETGPRWFGLHDADLVNALTLVKSQRETCLVVVLPLQPDFMPIGSVASVQFVFDRSNVRVSAVGSKINETEPGKFTIDQYEYKTTAFEWLRAIANLMPPVAGKLLEDRLWAFQSGRDATAPISTLNVPTEWFCERYPGLRVGVPAESLLV